MQAEKPGIDNSLWVCNFAAGHALVAGQLEPVHFAPCVSFTPESGMLYASPWWHQRGMW